MGFLRSLTQLLVSATFLAGTVFATRQEPVLQLHSDDAPTIVENAGMDMDMGIHTENLQALNASASGFEYQYFERTYSPAGWFQSSPLLDTHVEASMVNDMANKRKGTHYPYHVSAYTVSYPQAYVYYNIMWAVNSNSIKWKLVIHQSGAQLQSALNDNINQGYQVNQAGRREQRSPSMLESYSFDGQGTIYYAAVFFEKKYWPSGTKFEIAFGFPNDASYCCGTNSRWVSLRNAGFKPVTFAITEDPASKRLYVTDVWNSVNVGVWQGGMGKTAFQLQQTLGSLDNLSPVYLKAYRVSKQNGGHVILYTYLARQYDAPGKTLTTDVSNTAFAALAKLLKKPPQVFTSFHFDGEDDYEQRGSGGMYTALWEGVSVVNSILPSNFEFSEQK